MNTTFYITNKNNQLLELLNTIDHQIMESSIDEADTLVQLKEELLANDGIHITPEQVNLVISLLLSFVPSQIRELNG